MSDLDDALTHARKMATAQHTPVCSDALAEWEHRLRLHARWDVPHPGPKPDACPGCVSDADRALWARIAGELEAHLARQTEETLI